MRAESGLVGYTAGVCLWSDIEIENFVMRLLTSPDNNLPVFLWNKSGQTVETNYFKVYALFEPRPRGRSEPSRRLDIAILCFSKTWRLHILFALTPA
jgi:hypothetical protein